MHAFPSVEWFDSVKAAANDDPEFRALGTSDTTVGIKIGDQIFQLDFYAFECARVAEIDEDDLFDESEGEDDVFALDDERAACRGNRRRGGAPAGAP